MLSFMCQSSVSIHHSFKKILMNIILLLQKKYFFSEQIFFFFRFQYYYQVVRKAEVHLLQSKQEDKLEQPSFDQLIHIYLHKFQKGGIPCISIWHTEMNLNFGSDLSRFRILLKSFQQAWHRNMSTEWEEDGEQAIYYNISN